ncbi:MAG: FAD-dependent oxidoreductase [Oscillospiraceae bacterium]|nr:FAD-dependent oxidoreductase [Oscillospiraceae bacterium]
MQNSVTYTKNIELAYSCDIAVAGGGIAGVCAAIAAAKHGASVILVERFGIPGGNATSGGVAAFCGENAGQGAVFDEISAMLETLHAIGPYTPYPKDNRKFNHELLPFVLNSLLEKYQVRLLYHTRVADCIVEDGQITHLIISGPSGMQAIGAGYVIDCTGDACVARAAGFRVMKGRESDGMQLPMSEMFFVRHQTSAQCVPEGLLARIKDQDELPMTSIWPNGPGGNAIKVKIPKFDATDTESLTAAEIFARKRALQVTEYFKTVEGREWMFDRCSPIIGIREGARILGDCVLAVDDLRKGRQFGDAVAVGYYCLDGHSPDDDKRTYILPKDELAVPPYHIPLRCLIARDGKNLMMAGRCLSADQLALSSARVMTTCAMTGQAAGMACAFASAEKTEVRKICVSALQNALTENGAVLAIGRFN